MVSWGHRWIGSLARRLRLYVPRAYLTRFPLLLAVVLVGFAPFALMGLPAVFRSMLVLDAWGIALVALAATAAALTVLATRRIVLLHGPARFDASWPDVAVRVSRRALAGHLVLAAPLVLTAAWLSATEGRVGWVWAGLAVVGGAASASIFALGAVLVHALVANGGEPLPELVVPGNALVRAAHRRATVPTAGWLAGLVRRMRPWLGPGYLDGRGRVLPAHGFATGILLVYCLLYGIGYVAFRPGTAVGAAVPALTYLLAAATLATWLLAGLAFYLDRYRLPTLMPLVLWSFLVWGVSKSDHYFPLNGTPQAAALATPHDIAAARRSRLLTVVAVDGGGIQAASWAATVLTGIEERWPGFQESVRLISAVSGGSVGTLYFVDSLSESRTYPAAVGAAVRAHAIRGSLSEAAWGLAYPDLWRVLIPVPGSLRLIRDRGWAMEQGWRRGWPSPPSLADLRHGVAAGWRPAVAFNATRVEEGDRATFATFAVPDAWRVQTLESLYGRRDIAASTAARVSATFPYVTPISRALPDASQDRADHFADGGYYDNSGMGIAMRWLDQAMADDPEAYRGVAVAFVQIRSGPERTDTPVKDRGWLYEVIGPLQTVLAVRVTGQRERAETELGFLQRLWCGAGVDIRRFTFGFDRPDPPLSWQLTPDEIEHLAEQWRSPSNQNTLDALMRLSEHPAAECAARGVRLTSPR